ncbi:hypothetical protein DFS34DRAFT_110660 [Phlyctochytrium arcticum]|nr:hypothetical protein DFS34DRAFT_110660 [Phlyctochytrium arcticum]
MSSPSSPAGRRILVLVGVLAVTLLTLNVIYNRRPDSRLETPAGFQAQHTTCNPASWAADDWSPPCRQASQNALADIAAKVSRLEQNKSLPKACKIKDFGTNWGKHELCDRPPKRDAGCVFYSFGIDNDYSFDEQLSKDWNCRGYMLDPTVTHPSRIGTNLYFFSVGASLLDAADAGGAGSSMRGTTADGWQITSLPSLKSWLGTPHIDVLKMDCEGCEYSLARDVAALDPYFFANVDQLAIEIHISKAWIKSPAHAHYLGLLYHMLQYHGLHMVASDITPCAANDEAPGCPAELEAVNYPCGPTRMCHNYLFSKLD